MFKGALLGAAVGAVLSVIQVGDAQAERYRLSLSTWGSPKHPQVVEFVDRFMDAVKEKTDGRVSFRYFEGGEMVKQQFVPTAVPQGTVDISLSTLDNWSGRIPEVTITTSPLWTLSMEEARDRLLPGKPLFDYFDARLREDGAVLLALFDIGPPVVSTRFEVNGPDSMRGKSIRVYSKGAGEVMQAMGASPVVMGVGDVYSALQRGTVDGAMGGLQGAVGLKHYEVTKYVFAPNGAVGSLVHAYVMNKEKFDALPEDVQTAIMEAATAARNHAQQYMIDNYENFLEVVEENGLRVTRLEKGSDDWAAWRKALEPLSAASRNTYPEDLVEMIAQ